MNIYEKLVSTILALGLILCGTSNITKLDAQQLATNNNATQVWNDHNAFSQTDLDNNFSEYAAEEATLTLPETYSENEEENTETANVVGIVLDRETEMAVANAMIVANGQELISTGEDGRFQITNMPNDEYEWKIVADEYNDAYYKHYSVDGLDGANIFTFYISKDEAVVVDREQLHAGEQQVPKIGTINGKNIVSTQAMSTVPSVSSTVKVYYNNSTKTVNRQQYIYTVLSSELYTSSSYKAWGLTSSQIEELYIAQAIAANTFLEYAMKVYSNHSSSNYNVCSTTCCQVYDPTKVTQTAINATAEIFIPVNGMASTDIVLYMPTSTTYSYMWGAFFSSCKNNGTKTHSTQPALKAKSCTDLATGAGGHRYGLCQMGAAEMAKNGKKYYNIIHYYYSNCQIVTATMK